MLRCSKVLPLLLLPVVMAGCTSITNLTPRQQPRNAVGLYPVEMVWDSNRQTIRKESLKPSVQVGDEAFPMRQATMLKNRWETLIPVSASSNYINYRFKVDFEYNDIPVARTDSRLSAPYQLEIKDKK